MGQKEMENINKINISNGEATTIVRGGEKATPREPPKILTCSRSRPKKKFQRSILNVWCRARFNCG